MIEAVITSRRTLITGLVALVAAPAIVKVASLMPINSGLVPETPMQEYVRRVLDPMINEMATHQADAFGYMMRSYDDRMEVKRISNYEFYKGEQWPEEQVPHYGFVPALKEPGRVAIRELYRGSDRYWEYDVLLDKWSERVPLSPVPVAVAPLAMAGAALVAAPEILKTPVTRRFWAK